MRPQETKNPRTAGTVGGLKAHINSDSDCSAPAPLVHALALAERGIPVFPCRPDKRPLTGHGFKDASTDPAQITAWWTEFPAALIGVPTGESSGLLAIDIDPDGAAWYAEHFDRLACGRIHRTKRGHHLLYRMPTIEIRSSAGKIAPGVDVRAEGGYLIWWPAHGHAATGDLDDIGDAPDWIIDLLKEKPRQAASDVAGAPTTEGQRNGYLSKEAYRLRKQGKTAEQIHPVISAMNAAYCDPPLSEDEVRSIVEGKKRVQADGITVADFYAYLPSHQYIFTPSRELWPASSVNARVVAQTGKASEWLDEHRAVEQMTWAPGEPEVIRNRLVSSGGWIERDGCACFNLYQPPALTGGDPAKASRWVDHVHTVYPDEAEHIITWLAHRAQKPGDKVNHALVLGGMQGIGKDTLLEPAKHAVGPWNFEDVSPAHLLGRFNGFVKSVILRISEARDLGDVNRFAFYDHMKTYTAAPPDVLRCDEKHIREHAVMNVCGVIITTNHKSDGIYLPADDRRHHVAWSPLTREDFTPEYWRDLWGWYTAGGIGHVAAYLRTLDISNFDAKAPPQKTAAFWDIVDANRAPEDAELADVLDRAGNPPAITIQMLSDASDTAFAEWLRDRRNRRQIPHRLETAGYTPVRNDIAADGLWKVRGKRQAVYCRAELAVRDRIEAANRLCRGEVSEVSGSSFKTTNPESESKNGKTHARDGNGLNGGSLTSLTTLTGTACPESDEVAI